MKSGRCTGPAERLIRNADAWSHRSATTIWYRVPRVTQTLTSSADVGGGQVKPVAADCGALHAHAADRGVVRSQTMLVPAQVN
jgi:hypothetical protein